MSKLNCFGWQEKFVEYVNPTYKNYSRPLFLSIFVFLITYAIALGIFAGMMKQCTNEIGILDRFQLMNKYKDLDAKCMDWTAELNNNVVGSCQISGSLPYEYCGDFTTTAIQICTGDNPLILFQYRKCPKAFDTLGSAFGYVSIITTFIGIITIFMFKKCDVIKKLEDPEVEQKKKVVSDYEQVRCATSPEK